MIWAPLAAMIRSPLLLKPFTVWITTVMVQLLPGASDVPHVDD